MELLDAWRRRGREVEDRVLTIVWIRQALAVLVASVLAAFPVYFLWALAIRRDYSPEVWGEVIAVGIVYLLLIAPLILLVRSIGYALWYGFLGVVPFIGLPFLVRICWGLATNYRPIPDRAAERDRALFGLDDFDREVFRWRFDTTEGRFYSRRKTARRLKVPAKSVADAEQRILNRVEEHGEAEHKEL